MVSYFDVRSEPDHVCWSISIECIGRGKRSSATDGPFALCTALKLFELTTLMKSRMKEVKNRYEICRGTAHVSYHILM